MSVIVEQFQTVRFIQMMSLAFGLFTQVSGSGPLGPLVAFILILMENSVSKHCRSLSDAILCGIQSGSPLFADDPFMGFRVKLG